MGFSTWHLIFMAFNMMSITLGTKLNVLFFIVDDLRPDLGVYQSNNKGEFPGSTDPPMVTPNIDALAKESLLLTHAYAQMALCSPSRTSLMTGRRPDTTHIYDLDTYFRDIGGNFTTIPQYFSQNGYRTMGIGKVFHPNGYHDDPLSWTDGTSHPERDGYSTEYKASWTAVPDSLQNLQDERIATSTINALKKFAPDAKSGEKPFFLAAGFMKPHLPFVCPQKYFDLYPLDKIELPGNPFAPVNMPHIAWSNYGELSNWYMDIIQLSPSGEFNTTLPDDVTKNLRRAYYACVSYVDDLIGEVLKELKSLGLEKNTIVLLIGDHGWQLGEHAEWCKHTNFELATQVPFMIKIPGRTDKGIKSNVLTELVDIFETLVEAADLPTVPNCPRESSKVETCHQGLSLLPLIDDPDPQEWKLGAFSQFRRNLTRGHFMGHSIRTNQYRYTEWVPFSYAPNYRYDWNHLEGVELYDHDSDPYENVNVAHEEGYKSVRDTLSKALRAGWLDALPGKSGNPVPNKLMKNDLGQEI